MKKILPFILCNLLALASFAQIGINTDSPSPAAALEIKSSYNNKNYGGLLIPTVDATERDKISDKATTADGGMLIYYVEGNTRCLQIYDGINGSWADVYCMPTNYAPTASNVFISGIIEDTQTLTANYTYSDIENDAEGATTFEWFIADDAQGTNTTSLGVTTTATYTLQTADVSKFIFVRVTPVASAGEFIGSPVDSPLRGPIKAAGGVASDLFISEYVEGSSNNKIIEIANFTGQDVNLSEYHLRIFRQKGNLTGPISLTSNTIIDGDVFVMANNANVLATGEVDTQTGSLNFNGDDSVLLYYEPLGGTETLIDIIGPDSLINPGNDNPIFAQNVTLRRKLGFGPSTTYDDNDFDSFAEDDASGIGSHTY
ncbi:lamin tail domain-containing protein [uncultured Mesonia sp.]|uniref:lamin tail domain-containing protein n=1 Tax=uncultured Mesonia sp. TaxID=399731 RepID=UPI00374EA93A